MNPEKKYKRKEVRVSDKTLNDVKILFRKGMDIKDIAIELEVSEFIVRRAEYLLGRRERETYDNSSMQ